MIPDSASTTVRHVGHPATGPGDDRRVRHVSWVPMIPGPYTFYFAICFDPRSPTSQDERIARISGLASDLGAECCHIERHGDLITLQVEISDRVSATTFKLAAETALNETHL